MYLALVDRSTNTVVTRLVRTVAAPPAGDETSYYIEVTRSQFDAFEVVQYPQGGIRFWHVDPVDAKIMKLPDPRSILTVSMTPGPIVSVGEESTFTLTLTDQDGSPIPGQVQGVTSLWRAGEPSQALRATLTDGDGSFTRSFPQSGVYHLRVDGVFMQGDTTFTVVEDV